MVTDTLDVELQFRKLPDQGRDEVYDVWLLDQTQGTSDLPSRIESIRVTPAAVIPDLGMSATQFVNNFRNLSGLTERDGLQFGQWLHDLLFPASSEQRQTWDEVCARAMRESRPVRLQVSFADLAQKEHRGLLATLPYELLATSGSFLFRRKHWSIVRAFRGLDGATFELEPGHHIGLMWANPKSGDSKLPPALFDKHESHIATHGTSLGFHVQQPRRQATRQTLQDMVTAHTKPLPSLDVLSIVAHGSPGKLWLHHLGHKNYPDDPGEPIAASEFANHLRSAGVKVGMLWSCHGAEPDSDFGSVVHALLRDGGLVAVVGSQAALRAETATTPEFARELLNSLATTAEGHLDRAVSAARCVLPASDLQWAAPLYFARPLRGRSVSLAIPERTLESLQQRWSLTSAPDRSPHFKGRETDLAELLQAVRTCRCLTLTGLPGAGKSEMARELMERLAQLPAGPQRPVTDAVWVALAAVRTAADVRSKIAAVLDLKDADTDELLARQLKSHKKLLVLDNVEDVLAQERVGFRILLETVLHNASGMQVLLTSRQELGDLEGVICRQRRVDLLPAPYDREAFVSAASERLSEEDRASVELTRLVEILEGHPRSLMLIAGQVGRGRSMTRLREFLEQDTIDALTAYDLIGLQASAAQAAGNDDQLRARRLASSLNLSFAALQAESPAAADAYCWLGLFPSGVPANLLSRLFGDQAEDLSAVWLRHSLLQIVGPHRRLVLPAPLRWYARRQLETLPIELQADWFSKTCHTWAAWLRWQYETNLGTQNRRIATGVSADETQNLIELESFGYSSNAQTADLDALGMAYTFWAQCERFAARTSAAIDQLRVASDRFAARSRVARSNTLQALGDLQMRVDRLQEAEESYVAALDLYRETGDQRGEANTVRSLGSLYARRDQLKETLDSYRIALDLYSQLNDAMGAAQTFKLLGELQCNTGRLLDAEKSLEQAHLLYIEIKDLLGTANTLKVMGDLWSRRCQLQHAANKYDESLQIYRKLDDRLGEANVLKATGDLYARMQRTKDAEERYHSAIVLYKKLDARLGEANAWQALADLQLRMHRTSQARENYDLALTLFLEIEDRPGQSRTRKGIGDALVQDGQFQKAKEAYLTALAVNRETNDSLGEANIIHALGNLYAVDNPPLGFNTLRIALERCSEIGDPQGFAGTIGALSRVAMTAKEFVRAISLAGLAWSLLAKLEDHFGQALALDDLGQALAITNDEAALRASLYLEWVEWRTINQPAPDWLEPLLVSEIPGFDGLQIDTEFAVECRAVLEAAVARYRAELDAAGIDPLGPLSEE